MNYLKFKNYQPLFKGYQAKSLSISGTKIINPVIIAVMAEISTAAAAISFAFLILSSLPWVTVSDKCSIEVLKLSLIRTSAETNNIAIHSVKEILKMIPARITVKRMKR